jgi:hypothetical protein
MTSAAGVAREFVAPLRAALRAAPEPAVDAAVGAVIGAAIGAAIGARAAAGAAGRLDAEREAARVTVSAASVVERLGRAVAPPRAVAARGAALAS